MADKKISQLSSATTPLAGTEVLPIVQSGSTVKVSIDNVTKGRTVNATTFDTDVAAAGVTLSGTTLSADGTDANIDVNVTPKGTGSVNLTKVNIDGGTIDGTTIGGSSAAAGTFSTIFQGPAGGQGVNVGFSGVAGQGFSLRDTTNSRTYYITTETATGLAINAGGGAPITSVGSNLVFGTAGKGIDFSANTHAAGMTSELLDWYEEGNWTPALSLQSGSVTLAVAEGSYTRIGRQVTVHAYIKVNTPSTPSGFMLMTGIPFTPLGDSGYAASLVVNTMLTTVAGNWSAKARSNGDIRFWVGDNTTLSQPAANLQANSEIWLTCTYEVA